MSKKNFVTLILSTIGGLLFALGMCMALVEDWGTFAQGVVVGSIGFVILIAMLLVRRKMSGLPIVVKLSGKNLATLALGILGTVALGLGMCMVMVWEMMIFGIIVGIIGILLLLCLIPMVKGLE